MFLAISASAAPYDIFLVVDDSVAGSPNASTWPSAYPSIQDAIDAAVSGDELWVAAGTYTETITMKTGVRVYGGFFGDEFSLGARDYEANVTIIDASSLATADQFHVVTI